MKRFEKPTNYFNTVTKISVHIISEINLFSNFLNYMLLKIEI